MGRFVHPGSARYGSILDWSELTESRGGYLKVKPFVEYVERIIKDILYSEEGVIINSIGIQRENGELVIKLELYDRFLELSLRESDEIGLSGELVLENLLGDKLLVLKRLIISEGAKYFKEAVNVEFLFVSMQTLTSKGLADYISYNLERGYSLVEVLRLVSKEFKTNQAESDSSEVNRLNLSHRYNVVYSEGVRTFNKVLISGRYLLGYRIDVAGRFSRKQRASKRSICEGTVPLGGFQGSMDYGMTKAIMEYGVSSVRVWLYYDRDIVRKEYLCRIK